LAGELRPQLKSRVRQRHRSEMFEIRETEFIPLAEFPLRWRFTDARYAQLSPDMLRRIRPLSAAAAAQAHSQTIIRCQEAGAFTTSFRSDDAPAEVRQRLRELPPYVTCSVLISWDDQTAAVTEWDVFVEHWDDFCYPASDDVTVVPLAGAWTLCYRHYEVFQFESRPAAA
jgi:hypothetical protein